jgi:probable HAF family extracellular repeat protein
MPRARIRRAARPGLALLLACVAGLSACRDSAPGDAPDAVRGTFTGLGALPGYGASEASAVSSDGRVVVGTAASASAARQAFRWTAAQGMVGLGFLPGGTSSIGKGVSANGGVVVGDADGGSPLPSTAFRWSVDAGLVPLPGLSGSSACVAAGVSGDGDVVAGTCLAINDEAYRFTATTGAIGLGRLGTGSNATSSATTISADGRVIGGAGHPVLTGAVVWDAQSIATIVGAPMGTTGATVTALSRDGSLAAGTATDAAGTARAFRWSATAGIVPLASTAAFTGAAAAGMSADGRRIVGWATSAGADVAILWDDAGRMRVVSELLAADAVAASDGWRLLRARAISADGRAIVGDGIDRAGVRQAWLVTLPD